jgi:hypothetical protein
MRASTTRVDGRWKRDLTLRGLVEKELTRERVGIKRATELVVHFYIGAYIKNTMQVHASRKGNRPR